MARPTTFTFEQKVDHFEKAVRHDILDAVKHSLKHNPPFYLGAVRQLTVYFEMIGKYINGFAAEGKSEYYFKEGCKEVNSIRSPRAPPQDHHLKRFYELIRCGLYHQGFPSLRKVRIDANYTGSALRAGEPSGDLIVFPHGLRRMVERHFDEYVAKLRDPANTTLRANFEKRFDFESGL